MDFGFKFAESVGAIGGGIAGLLKGSPETFQAGKETLNEIWNPAKKEKDKRKKGKGVFDPDTMDSAEKPAEKN